ncbi:NmrA family NAD(P)-binding protein [Aliihoeflea aestuarii]|jgi:NAD(P)H dehydrogenase (quinone)|uniref:SDR family oxidoreductase n=1 Tax=Aliihoeflea aestuarii TaxID=453840 RepID=UPI0020962EC8|nr:SDR family oxidoreductase [Aliihoeflea aestuarii]MCO6392103.1 NmrA family NAD(P)-binding protein [Aliihoeflea aestuarii]
MTIAVTGATGQFGRLVIETLKTRTKDDIVALARSPQKAADLGVETRRADYDDAASLEAALKGVDTLLLISSSEVGKRAAQHHHVIEAAKKNAVKWIVYTSLLRADSSTLSLAAEHAETERELKASGIPYTILRNGWYTENYTGSLEGAVAAGAIIGSAGKARISGASRKDYAEAAVAVLTTPGHEGKVYELAGDESFSLEELAAEVSKQTGKAVTYKDLPEADYAKTLEGFGLPAGLAAAIAGWDVAAGEGALYDDGRALSKLIGRPTTPFTQTVKATFA